MNYQEFVKQKSKEGIKDFKEIGNLWKEFKANQEPTNQPPHYEYTQQTNGDTTMIHLQKIDNCLAEVRRVMQQLVYKGEEILKATQDCEQEANDRYMNSRYGAVKYCLEIIQKQNSYINNVIGQSHRMENNAEVGELNMMELKRRLKE